MTPSLPPAFVPWFEARCPDIPVPGALAALALAASGASAPFIARYRREATSNLDEAAVRRCLAAREQWERVVARQDVILESIVRHATLTPELRERIRATFDPVALEDLYQPFRQRKKGRADAAREAGLLPLAEWIWNCGHGTETPHEGQTLELWAFTFRDEEKSVPDARSAIEGARDILVERLADDASLRGEARRIYLDEGWLRATRTEKARPGGRFEDYFDLHEKVSALLAPAAAHRYLALRRGLSEGELLLAIGPGPGDEAFEDRVLALFESAALSVPESPGAEVLRQAARIAYKGLVRSALENDVHRTLKDNADAAESAAFAESVRRTLLEAPFGPRPVLGVHPTREGIGASVVGAGGRLVQGVTVPAPADGEAATLDAVIALAKEHAVEAVAIARSSLGREVELALRPRLREAGVGGPVVQVNDAGAGSVAASEGARAELPDLDPPARAAVSIARRLQDPLAELVKVDARHLGGGQYPHDVAPAVLHRATDTVIESCVHAVGVDLATASRPLLARVSGFGPGLAAAIDEWRSATGTPRSRAQLLEVPGLPSAAFEQAAGFLRVRGGEHALDATGVHPERYPILEETAARHGRSIAELLGPEGAALVRADEKAREALGTWTHADVVTELEHAGRDPRPAFVPFAFREDLRTIEDLRPGVRCPGIVNHVTSFGAFVDVGVRTDGLVHVSQLGRRGSTDARDLIRPGERVEVRVVKVDLARKQISLSLRPPSPKRPAPNARARRASSSSAPVAATPAEPTKAARRPKPSRPRPSGPGPGGGRPAGRPSSERPAERRPAERRPAFNNPFSVLADLKVSRRKS